MDLHPSPPPVLRSIAGSWLRLLDEANSSVQIAAFYFSLRGGESANSSDSQVGSVARFCNLTTPPSF